MMLQTFQAYMQFKEIPRKLVVAKRLSQCLNPALPTGVHQRALDVYSHILAVLGVSHLLHGHILINNVHGASPKVCREILRYGRPGCFHSSSTQQHL